MAIIEEIGLAELMGLLDPAEARDPEKDRDEAMKAVFISIHLIRRAFNDDTPDSELANVAATALESHFDHLLALDPDGGSGLTTVFEEFFDSFAKDMRGNLSVLRDLAIFRLTARGEYERALEMATRLADLGADRDDPDVDGRDDPACDGGTDDIEAEVERARDERKMKAMHPPRLTDRMWERAVIYSWRAPDLDEALELWDSAGPECGDGVHVARLGPIEESE